MYKILWQTHNYPDAINWALENPQDSIVSEMLWLDIMASVGNSKFNSSLQPNHFFKQNMIQRNLLPIAYKTHKMLYGFLINYCIENQKFVQPAAKQLQLAGLNKEAQDLINESTNSGFLNKKLSGIYSFFSK